MAAIAITTTATPTPIPAAAPGDKDGEDDIAAVEGEEVLNGDDENNDD